VVHLTKIVDFHDCKWEMLVFLMQLQCTGGTAGCSAFIPQVVQCYNRGTDGIEVQVGSFGLITLDYFK